MLMLTFVWLTARWMQLEVSRPATLMHSVRPDQTHAAMRKVKGHISSFMKFKRQLDGIKSIANE